LRRARSTPAIAGFAIAVDGMLLATRRDATAEERASPMTTGQDDHPPRNRAHGADDRSIRRGVARAQRTTRAGARLAPRSEVP
jgi:hypothetical protein